MQKKDKYILAGAILLTCIFFVLYSYEVYHRPQAVALAPSTLAASTSGAPVRLRIPVIKVDAAVESLGQTTTGAMDAPKGPADVAWYKLGPRPGEVGSAVIDGHFGWKDGKAAVFDKLRSLNKGDRIIVEDDKGETIVFVVRELRDYDEKASTQAVFNSSDGKAHLNLITCEGVWNAATKSYGSRLVVFADRE